MDNIIKTKFVQLKEIFHFHVDLKNIKFYKTIKNITNHVFFLGSAILLSSLTSFLLTIHQPDIADYKFFIRIFVTILFLPLFYTLMEKLDYKFNFKFTKLYSGLPEFLRKLPFVKSAEDSFFFSREKISKMLSQTESQLVFFDFFNMVKSYIILPAQNLAFSKNINSFKYYLECNDFLKAADLFIELYSFSHQFEYLIYDNQQNEHDLQLLETRKKFIDEFLHDKKIDDASTHYFKYAKSKTPEKKEQQKVNWKRLMDE